MLKILKIKTANDYSRYVGLEVKHPLVSVVEYADVSPVRNSSLNTYEFMRCSRLPFSLMASSVFQT